MSIYGNKILQEYSGNDYDNKNFANCMEELGKIGAYYVQIDAEIANLVNFIIKEMNKCKTSEQMKKAIQTCYNHGDDTVKKLNDIYDKFAEAPTFRRFKSLCKKFSVKYSDVTMEDKKKWTETFTDYHKDMVKIIKAFDDAWIKSANAEIGRLDRIDYEYNDKLVKHLNGWSQLLYGYFNYTHGNILYVLRKLDPSFEDTLKYKLVQKIFKSKEKK